MKHIFTKYFTVNDTLFVVALVVALALAWNTVSAMQRNYYLEQRFDKLTADVELHELENQNLAYTIAYLKSDDYLELAAREKFNKAVSGETLVLLPGLARSDIRQSTHTPSLQTKTHVESKGWRGNISAWWKFLHGGKQSANLQVVD